LTGGILGCITGFVLTYWTFFAWPLHVGGKPVSSFPVAVVIMFELTVLFTGLFGFAGVLFHTRKSRKRLSPAYREAFSVDRYGVYVVDDQPDAVESIMRDTGAVAVDRGVGE